MAGLYIHIPFCKKACTYCDFHFSTRLENVNPVLHAMHLELAYWREHWPLRELDTIYFGGGTPSLLNEKQIAALFEEIRKHFSIRNQAELTLEANPEDITMNRVKHWKSLGVNRLSIGLQAFQDEILGWMNRAHNAQEAYDSVRLAHSAGIENISVDLIYGIPGLEMDTWKKNIDRVLELPIQHISCYALTVEEKTVLDHQVKKAQVEMPNDEEVNLQFDYLGERLEKEGFEHYEISNLGRPGYFSRHNSNYWNRIPYLGIGPSAHSFLNEQRWFNPRNNHEYMRMWEEKTPRF
ncbi:MAG: radical SAM family heme chaperone HemW, partial [Luteibaculum sp.]